jgi:two-component system, NarL family, nitrate/nitrite response regulator NarL
LSASATSDDDEASSSRTTHSRVGVLIVTDVRLYRHELAGTLRRHQTIRVLGTAGDVDEALGWARSHSPEVIIVDMVMRNGTPTVRALAEGIPQAGVLALAVPESENEVIACVEAGAAGCVPREAPLEEVISAVESIARGEAPCSPRMTVALLKRVRERAAVPPDGPEARLTAREREVLGLVEQGLSNKQIALSLNIETATVKNHVHRILEKLKVTRRGEAAAAFRRGTGRN